MDVCDAPINMAAKIPTEQEEVPLDLVINEAYLLFDEFIRQNEPLVQHWEEDLRPPQPVGFAADPTDAPIAKPLLFKSNKKSYERNESLLDDNCVPDCEARERVEVAQEEEGSKQVNEKTKELASELMRAGDALCQQYEGKVKDVESKLLQLVTTEAASLTYDRFSRAADDLIGRDKNWTTFIFATQVAKRLCRHSKQAFVYGKDHFQRYVSTFAPAMQHSGGVENFVKQRPL